eukprot:COSAG04_NODE_4454_length_2083_cov_1.026714_2_plen_280_part_01
MLTKGFEVDLKTTWPEKLSVTFEVLPAARPVEEKRCVICCGKPSNGMLIGPHACKKGICEHPGEKGHLNFLLELSDSEEEEDLIDENRSPFVLNIGDAWILNVVTNPELAALPIYDPERPASLARAYWCTQPLPHFCRWLQLPKGFEMVLLCSAVKIERSDAQACFNHLLLCGNTKSGPKTIKPFSGGTRGGANEHSSPEHVREHELFLSRKGDLMINKNEFQCYSALQLQQRSESMAVITDHVPIEYGGFTYRRAAQEGRIGRSRSRQQRRGAGRPAAR